MPSRKQVMRISNSKYTVKGKRRTKLNKINNDSRSKQKNKTNSYNNRYNKKESNITTNYFKQISQYKSNAHIFEPCYSNYRCNEDGKIVNIMYSPKCSDDESIISSSTYYGTMFDTDSSSSYPCSISIDMNIKWCITLKVCKNNGYQSGKLQRIELKYLCINDKVLDYFCIVTPSTSAKLRHLHNVNIIYDTSLDIYNICNGMMHHSVKPSNYRLSYQHYIWKCHKNTDIFTLKDILMKYSDNLLTTDVCNIITHFLENDCNDLIYINIYGKNQNDWRASCFCPYGSYGYLHNGGSFKFKYIKYKWNIPYKYQHSHGQRGIKFVQYTDTNQYIDALIKNNAFLRDVKYHYTMNREQRFNIINEINQKIKQPNTTKIGDFDAKLTEKLNVEFNIINHKYQCWVKNHVPPPKQFHGILNKIHDDRYSFDYSYNDKDEKQKWYKKKQRRNVKLCISLN